MQQRVSEVVCCVRLSVPPAARHHHHAPGEREIRLHALGREDVDGPLSRVGLVALGLQQMPPAFFHDGTGQFGLAVQRVRGDHPVVRLQTPERLGAIAGDVEIHPAAGVTGDGAGVGFRIGEAFGRKGTASKVLVPLGRQRPKGGSHGQGGRVGGGGLGNHHGETRVLDDQLRSGDGLRCAPIDPVVAILESVAGGPHANRTTGLKSISATCRRKSPTERDASKAMGFLERGI